MNRKVIAFIVFGISMLLTLAGVTETLATYFKIKEWIIVQGQMGLLILYILFSDYQSKEEVDGAITEWKDTLKGVNRVSTMHQDDFYAQFEGKLKTAKKFVDICHFGKEPPLRRGKTNEKEYYDGSSTTVKRSPATFRRLERLTMDKVEWIEKLIETYTDQKNYSLHCLLDNDITSDQIGAVSIQRIDESETYLVALAEHYSTTGVRDIHIVSPEVNQLAAQYFNSRLWGRSTPIIERGSFKKDEWEKCKKWLQDLNSNNGTKK